MSEKDFKDMFIAELVRQMLDDVKKESEFEEGKSGKGEEYPGLDGFINILEKAGLDGAYEDAWKAEEDWLKTRLKEASKRLYGGRVDDRFPFMPLFIIGLYGMIARIRTDLDENEFMDVINENCNLIDDLY